MSIVIEAEDIEKAKELADQFYYRINWYRFDKNADGDIEVYVEKTKSTSVDDIEDYLERLIKTSP